MLRVTLEQAGALYNINNADRPKESWDTMDEMRPGISFLDLEPLTFTDDFESFILINRPYMEVIDIDYRGLL